MVMLQIKRQFGLVVSKRESQSKGSEFETHLISIILDGNRVKAMPG